MRRLPKRERVPRYVPRLPGTVCLADFLSDALACGHRFRTFHVVNDFDREALPIEVDTSITSRRFVRIFEQREADHGLPRVLRTDNDQEIQGEAIVQWAKANRSRTSSPASPTRTPTSNASTARFAD